MFADPDAARIAAFVESIGLPVTPARVDSALLAGIRPYRGALLVDEARLAYPGDLLHEAGHLALTDPALRPAIEEIGQDPGEEMGAIAWSYAAALAIGLDLAVLFHPAGYRGGAQALIDNFTQGRTFGVPMLAWYGMTVSPGSAEAKAGAAPFPHMLRWLR